MRQKLVAQPEAGLGEVPARTVHSARPPGPVRTIVPTKRRVTLRSFVDAWPMLRVLAVRDLKGRYKQSALGPLWLLVQPLGVLAAFTVVFKGVADIDTQGVPYPLFGIAGLCVWSFFQLVVVNTTGAVFTNKALVRRLPIPRVVFPLAGTMIQLPVLAVTLALTLIMVYTIGDGLPLQALLLPIALAWLLALTLGIVSLLSALTVRFRDVFAAVPLVTQAGVFLTPIGYPIPPDASQLATIAFALNPLTGVIEFWRWCLLSGHEASLLAIAVSLPVTLAFAVGGWWVFARLEVKFADYV